MYTRRSMFSNETDRDTEIGEVKQKGNRAKTCISLIWIEVDFTLKTHIHVIFTMLSEQLFFTHTSIHYYSQHCANDQNDHVT